MKTIDAVPGKILLLKEFVHFLKFHDLVMIHLRPGSVVTFIGDFSKWFDAHQVSHFASLERWVLFLHHEHGIIFDAFGEEQYAQIKESYFEKFEVVTYKM